MSPEMTKHYQAHADREAKEKYLAQLPDFLGSSSSRPQLPATSCRDRLNQVLALLPEDAVQQVLAYAETLNPR